MIAPVGSHDDDALMLLHFCEEHVDVVAAVLLPVLKDGLTLIKEQQSIMNLGLPACPGNMLLADLCQRVLLHCMSCLCCQAGMSDESQLASHPRLSGSKLEQNTQTGTNTSTKSECQGEFSARVCEGQLRMQSPCCLR